ncbi:MAG TPA: DNA-binding response regulator, partial [Xanthomarina gelatinilytica]|nr:DNA-binding response regulator [Xanthomarina gelatinilytica]
YTKLFLEDDMIVSHEKISYYETLLEASNYLRVHKSFLVSIGKIKFIEGNRIVIKDHKIPIGQTYKSRINKLYGS